MFGVVATRGGVLLTAPAMNGCAPRVAVAGGMVIKASTQRRAANKTIEVRICATGSHSQAAACLPQGCFVGAELTKISQVKSSQVKSSQVKSCELPKHIFDTV